MAPVWQLCEGGELAELRLALIRGEDVNSIKDEECKETGLMLAVLQEHNSVVRLLLEQPTLDLNCTDSQGATALHHAADGDNAEAAKMLLADPRLNTANLKDEYGDTPAMYTMTHECDQPAAINVLRELVAHPSVDLDIREESGMSLEEVARWVLQQ